MSLQLIGVSRRFGSQQALDGVSLNVRAGDCYGFLGHNGAGKTTAMRIALGLLRPDTGQVLVQGFDATAHPREARARMGGLIEAPGFHPSLDGTRNLELLARLQGVADPRREAGRVLELVGLQNVGKKPTGAYSQGMRQRLGIAQALLGSPSIVLLDEPTNGLDPEGIASIHALLARLTRDENTTVLLSSHRLAEVAAVCNRVAVLREGRLLLESETAELLSGDAQIAQVADVAAASELLTEAGFDVRNASDGPGEGAVEIAVAVDGAPRALETLVRGGITPSSFAPAARGLEEVYLRLAQNGGEASRPAPHVAVVAPAEVLAPSLPTLRVVGYDARRWTSRLSVPLLLCAPAVVGAVGVAFRAAEAARDAAEMEDGTLASATAVTAFEGVGVALRTGVPMLALVAAGLASQTLAGERARGTLRNVALRPIGRLRTVIGKGLATVGACAVSHVLLVLAALVTAGALFDFADVTEVMFNGEPFVLTPADELWPELRRVVIATFPAAAALTAVGLLASSLFRGSASALAGTIGAIVALDVLRAPLRGFDLESALPTAYLPTALGDTSAVRTFLDLSRGISNAPDAPGSMAVWVPFAWLAGCVGIAAVVHMRREIR